MPIKEIMMLSAGILGAIFVTHGPFHFRETVRAYQVRILREVGRTDNWGNPSIFPKHRPSQKQ